MIGINQVRDNLNAGYGGPAYTTPGGKCWKHVCSVRLMFRTGTPFDDKFKDVKKSCENPLWSQFLFQFKKTKVCKPDRKTGFLHLRMIMELNRLLTLLILLSTEILFIKPEHGLHSLILIMMEKLCVKMKMEICQEVKVQGQASLIPFLQEANKDICDMVKKYVNRFVS